VGATASSPPVPYIFCVKVLALVRIKHALWAGLALGALVLSACGSSQGSPATDTAAAQPIFPNSPTVHVPSGQAPKSLVIKDIKEGKGLAVPPIANEAQVKITALYTAINYKTGEIYEERWDPHDPYVVAFDSSLDDTWEQGLPGMKAGGRRELIAPAEMSFSQLPLAYVIDLLSVKKIGPAS
jgi:FKBP-type peptidyl-prolyl cis-trans isomerase